MSYSSQIKADSILDISKFRWFRKRSKSIFDHDSSELSLLQPPLRVRGRECTLQVKSGEYIVFFNFSHKTCRKYSPLAMPSFLFHLQTCNNQSKNEGKPRTLWKKGLQATSPSTYKYDHQLVAIREWRETVATQQYFSMTKLPMTHALENKTQQSAIRNGSKNVWESAENEDKWNHFCNWLLEHCTDMQQSNRT